MSWRIVEISSGSKLELKLNYLVVRNVEAIHKVFLPEIAVLIIENTSVSMTASLLCELSKNKVKVIFCDEKRNPYGELVPYYGTHDTVSKLRNQNKWDLDIGSEVWATIVRQKISKQRDVLNRAGFIERSELLDSYISQVEKGDRTNREGHAAKVYFNTLFGNNFSRRDDSIINSALNYGYSILLSTFNREITVSGYLTQIGIFHDNLFNPFNLGSDLMESFRPIVDEQVLTMNIEEFGTSEKRGLVDILNKTVCINGRENVLLNAIRVYVQSFIASMEDKDPGRLLDYEV